MLVFGLSLASADEAGAIALAVGPGAESPGCVWACAWGSIRAGSRLASGAAGNALPVDAFSVSPGADSIFGSGFGAGGADSSGFAASRGAGGGRGGPTVGGAAAGALFAGGVLRAVAPGALGFVESGDDCGPYGLMALGMCTSGGPP